MANRRIAVPHLYGGVSKQAPTLRHLNQVSDADNALFNVATGIEKRPGTTAEFAVTSLSADGDYRLHPIDRDGTEQYLVIYGDSTLRIFDLDGNECDVVTSADAQTYIDAGSADADELRLLTIADYTLLVNTTVETGAQYSDNFTVAGTHNTTATLFSQQPENLSYHRVREDSDGETAGYWKYTPGVGTFAQTVFPVCSDGLSVKTAYNASSKNPAGFAGFFQRVATDSGSYSWDVSEMELSKTAAFKGYTFREGDSIRVAGGTGVATGDYGITSKVDDDTITLATQPKSSDVANVTVNGIGRSWEVTGLDMSADSFDNMHDVAIRFQDAIRDASGTDACLYWTADVDGGSNVRGHFTLISPYRGEGTTISAIANSSDANDVSYITAGLPFYNTGSTITAGTGYPGTDTLTPADRWTRVAAPYQEDAELDPDTMPIKIVREYAGEYYGDSYADVILADNPAFYWRLGDSSGTTASDETNRNDGTYVGSPNLSTLGAVRGTNKCVLLNGTSQYVNVGTVGIGAILPTQITIEAWAKVDGGGGGTIIGVNDNTGTQHQLRLTASESNVYWFVTLPISGTTGCAIARGYVPTTYFADNDWHHIVVTFDATALEPPTLTPVDTRTYIDGVQLTPNVLVTNQPSAALTPAVTGTDVFVGAYNDAVAATVSDYFKGSIDEVAIYHGALTKTQVNLHYRAGVAHTGGLFTVGAIEWNPRITGTKTTNPVPKFVDDERTIADIQLHRNRLAIGSSADVFFTQAGDLFNVYLDDAFNLADADPIDIPMPSASVAELDYMVPFRKGMTFFAKGGAQFELNAPEVLTYNTAAITPSTRYEHVPGVRPATLGELIYYAALEQDATQLRMHYRDDDTNTARSVDVTAHVPRYLPSAIRTIVALPNANAVYVLPTAQDKLYVYRMFWSGNKQVQSAWATYTFDSAERLVDIAPIGETVYALVENADGYFIRGMASREESALTGMDYPVLLDNRQTVTGVHAAGTTTWTLPIADASVDTAVLGPDFGDSIGTSVALTQSDSSTYTATGDYSAGEAYIGTAYEMAVELSRPYIRQDDDSILNATVQMRRLILNYTQTGAFTVQAQTGSRTAREYDYAVAGGDITEEGNYRAPVLGRTSDTVVTITNDTPKPCRISQVEYVVSFTPKDR